ncbi:MAG: cupin domain-containing protein [Bacteroidetes bacterium]|nr:cupin domain-containing protein [Bacteroidota bacterium]
MPTVFKNKDREFQDDPKMVSPFLIQTAIPRLSMSAGARNLLFDMRLLKPGQYSFPYHSHRNAEEMMMVVSGSMTARTPEGLEVLETGDIIFFEFGDSGAHQFFNHTSKPCTYLDVRTFLGLDVSDYPDTGKVNIIPQFELYDSKTRIRYFDGEEKVSEKWEGLRKKK